MAQAPQPPMRPGQPPQQAAVSVPGIPPKPNMEETRSQQLSEATLAEQEAGRRTMATVTDRLKVEQEEGARVMARNAAAAGRRLPPQQPPAPPPQQPRPNPLHG